MGHRKRRNKAQRRSKLASEKRHQLRIGKGKDKGKGRSVFFERGGKVVEYTETRTERGGIRLVKRPPIQDDDCVTFVPLVIPDGHQLSPYRATG